MVGYDKNEGFFFYFMDYLVLMNKCFFVVYGYGVFFFFVILDRYYIEGN